MPRMLVVLCVGLLGATLLPLGISSSSSASTLDAITCKDSKDVPTADFCFIDYFPPHTRKIDERLEKALPPAKPTDPELRSIAVVVSISEYPNFADPKARSVPAIKFDLSNIVGFLREQQFDEIILLKDEKATRDAIDNVLSDYVYNSVRQYQKRSRFVFIFDGHGTKPEANGLQGGMALSGSFGDGDPDYKNSFSLADLRNRLEFIGTFTYQSLALLGSCYSGGVFPASAVGGDTYNPFEPGAHAVTAAAADQLAWEHPGGQGTVFFDEFLYAARHERPDRFDFSSIWTSDQAGNSVRTNYSVIRLLRVIEDVNSDLETRENPRTGSVYPSVRLGTVAPNMGYSGAFFFLSSILPQDVKIEPGRTSFFPQSAEPTDQKPPSKILAIGENTGSAIRGHPEIKVFGIPEFYRIRGVDLSHFNGAVDFSKLQDQGIKFAYLKASEGASDIDPKFVDFAVAARKQNMDIGIYHVFRFKNSAEEQFRNLSKQVQAIRDKLGNLDLLPIAVDAQYMFLKEDGGPASPSEKNYYDLRQFLQMVQNEFGRPPVLYIPAFGEVVNFDTTFDAYPIWVASYRKGGKGVPSLRGGNPWTFWQFRNDAQVAGLEGLFDLDVFFGSDDEYQAFKSGAGNIALKAAVGGGR